MCNTLTQIPSQKELNLTEVFLLDASTADNPSEKRKGEWKDVSDKATKPGQRSVMSTLRKSGQPTGRPPDAQNINKVTFSPGLIPGRGEDRGSTRNLRRTQRGKVGKQVTAPWLTRRIIMGIAPHKTLGAVFGNQDLVSLKYWGRPQDVRMVCSMETHGQKHIYVSLKKKVPSYIQGCPS